MTTGEQTAADVLAHCITTDWIDRPALARRAELRGEAIHRPGLLDPDRLRDAIEERHALHATLDDARFTIGAAAVAIATADAESALANSRERLADRIEALTAAADVLDRYDRPLHRRRHAAEIAGAQKTVEAVPAMIEQSRIAVAPARLLSLMCTIDSPTQRQSWRRWVGTKRRSPASTTPCSPTQSSERESPEPNAQPSSSS